MIAVSLDAEGQIFPVAFSIVGGENLANWRWFLGLLKNVVGTRTLTIVSDRNPGLQTALEELFGHCNVAYWLEHLKTNLKNNAGARICPHLRKAAECTTEQELAAVLQEMKEIFPKGFSYLDKIDKSKWTDLYFLGRRYGHYTSNISESLNAWINSERRMPVVKSMEWIRRKLMKWFYERKKKANAMKGLLVDSLEAIVAKIDDKARRLEVLASSDVIFEVLSTTTRIVKLEEQYCSCGQWKRSGIVCVHVLAVLLHQGFDFVNFCEPFFLTEKYCAIYERSLMPVPCREEWSIEDLEQPVLLGLQPPQGNKQSGRGRRQVNRRRRWSER
ncbi:hypothetical protein GEMRC1_011563 [Eukaryota sp. GEM-RC1]